MNRRDFLKASAAVFVGAQIPLALAMPRALPDMVIFDQFRAEGIEKESRAGRVTVFRGETPLLQFALNTFGGLLFWRARIMDEIIIAPNDLRIEATPGIRAVARLRARIDDPWTGGYLKDDTGAIHLIKLTSASSPAKPVRET